MAKGRGWLILAPESIALLVGAGLFSGFVAGLFGIGGGVILVPVFWFVFEKLGVPPDVSVKLSVGTSLAVITLVTFLTSGVHVVKGRVDKKLLKSVLLWILPGVAFGVFSSHYLPAGVIKKIFAVILFFVSIRLISGIGYFKVSIREKVLIPTAVFSSAFLSSLLGIGGGVIINTALFSFSRWEVHRSVALASVISFLNALFGSLLYAFVGYVHPHAAFFVTLGAIPGSKLGLRLLHRLQGVSLKRVFGFLLFAVALRILAS